MSNENVPKAIKDISKEVANLIKTTETPDFLVLLRTFKPQEVKQLLADVLYDNAIFIRSNGWNLTSYENEIKEGYADSSAYFIAFATELADDVHNFPHYLVNEERFNKDLKYILIELATILKTLYVIGKTNFTGSIITFDQFTSGTKVLQRLENQNS